MRLRYLGPSDVTNAEVGRQNPEKGPLLQNAHVYEVSGEAAKELLGTGNWKREDAPKSEAKSDKES